MNSLDESKYIFIESLEFSLILDEIYLDVVFALVQKEKEPSNLISKVLKDIISDYKENEDVFHDDCLPTCLNSSDLDLLKIPDYEVLSI